VESDTRKQALASYRSSVLIHLLVRIRRCMLSQLVVHFSDVDAEPRAGSGVVRIELLRFLTGCRTRRLNQVWFCFISSRGLIVLLLIRATLYVLVILVGVCSVFWLF